MCGLLVAWGRFSKDDFLYALNRQAHRGPDDHGYLRLDALQLGHRRLSIIDLHAEAVQPMGNVTDDLHCIFNGEIYNYLEIKEELKSAGYQFRTESDTEVLINAYHYYGEECLTRFIGMFAFVIWDKRDASLFVARDRLGIKPLYYSFWDGQFVFSSEVKSILALGKQKQLNLSAVSSFFSYRYPVSGSSFFDGIDQVPAGHCAKFKVSETPQFRRYWDFIGFVDQQGKDLGEAFYLERLKSLFASSVQYRMRADVPVGAYLSGGVDSSAVVAEMAAQTQMPVKTFTIGFTEEGFNEFEYAREVADRYQTDHHEIVLKADDYLATMQEVIKLKDAPLGVPNEVPLYLMSKELKKHITVVLSGEGADEIFGGYGRLFRSTDDFQKIQNVHAGIEVSEPLKMALQKKYGMCLPRDEVEHFLFLYRYTGLEQKQQLLGERFHGTHFDADFDRLFRQVFESLPENAGYLTRVMAAFEKLHLPGLLQRVDITTMGASVEARVPFVDHRLVEFAFTVPEKYKLKWSSDPHSVCDLLGDQISEVHDTPKYLLKKAMEDKLSSRTLYRRKMGFPVPLNRWFGGDFNQYAKSRLLNGRSVTEGLISKAYIEQLLGNEKLGENHGLAMKVWMCLSLETFLESV